jgi:hypothetical protein
MILITCKRDFNHAEVADVSLSLFVAKGKYFLIGLIVNKIQNKGYLSSFLVILYEPKA